MTDMAVVIVFSLAGAVAYASLMSLFDEHRRAKKPAPLSHPPGDPTQLLARALRAEATCVQKDVQISELRSSLLLVMKDMGELGESLQFVVTELERTSLELQAKTELLVALSGQTLPPKTPPDKPS